MSQRAIKKNKRHVFMAHRVLNAHRLTTVSALHPSISLESWLLI